MLKKKKVLSHSNLFLFHIEDLRGNLYRVGTNEKGALLAELGPYLRFLLLTVVFEQHSCQPNLAKSVRV